jgi:L-ascorbate metabolism protein UlaG (beta-lactamase superfamily)
MSLLHRARKHKGRFLNPEPTAVGGFRTILKVLPLFLHNREETQPRGQLGPFRTDAALFKTAPPSGLRVTWFGHSSLYVEIDGFRLLIDPVWEQRASPLQWMGPKRFFAPTLALEELPPADAVLISHDHYDHLGARTVRTLAKLARWEKTAWVTLLGVGRRLKKLGVREELITELDWTESRTLQAADGAATLRMDAWPSRHFSGRGLRDRFSTLWGSFVLEGAQHRVYFGADSGWWKGFAEVAARYDGFDLTMLEVGAFHPLWDSIHLGPENALRAYEAMGGKTKAGLLMPIHWGLFNLALHDWRHPIEKMEEAAARGMPVWSPEPGVPTEVAGAALSTWWKR